jgi:hypothetical protein
MSEILVSIASVSLVEVIKRPLAVVGSVSIHGRKARNEFTRGGVEVGGSDLGGGDVASDVTGGGWKT